MKTDFNDENNGATTIRNILILVLLFRFAGGLEYIFFLTTLFIGIGYLLRFITNENQNFKNEDSVNTTITIEEKKNTNEKVLTKTSPKRKFSKKKSYKTLEEQEKLSKIIYWQGRMENKEIEKERLQILQTKLIAGKKTGYNRFERLKSIKEFTPYINFPPEEDFIAHDLKLLKYISRIYGFNKIKNREKFSLILYSEDSKIWFSENKDSGFHSYITWAELKEWIFEYSGFVEKEFKEDEDFVSILDLLHSCVIGNVLIALNILKQKGELSRTVFSILIGTYQGFYSLRDKEESIAELLKLADEIIVKYVPSQIWNHCKRLPGQYAQNDKGILNVELLRFFTNFNINESFCQKFLVKRKRIPLHERLVHNSGIIFLINFEQKDELTDVLQELRLLPLKVSIRFIGKGNIVPALNKIESCLGEKLNISVVSLEEGLDLGLSRGTVNELVEEVELENFYCKNKCKVVFSAVKSLIWTDSGSLMQNVGDNFPSLERLKVQCSTEILSFSKTEGFPLKLKLPHLKYLKLDTTRIENIYLLLKVSPNLESIQLENNNLLELSSEFVNEVLKRNVRVYSYRNPKVTLPNIDEITLPQSSCQGKFTFNHSNIDKETKDTYKRKYPDNFYF